MVHRRSTAPPALAWLANYGAVELHPWTSTRRRAARADLGAHRHRPRHRRRPSTTCSCSPACYRTALDHLGVRGRPEGDRQARHPDLGAGRRRATRSTTPGPGWRRVSRAIGADRARPGQLGVGRSPSAAARPGSTTRRTPSTRRWSRRSAPARRRARRCRCRSTWDELDDPDLRPDRWTIRTVVDRLATAGDPLAPLIGLQQRLPAL